MSIYTIVDRPLWWHTHGLRQTASGYGRKLTSPYCVQIDGEERLRRVYTTIYSNAGSSWFMVKGEKIFLPSVAAPGDRNTLAGDPVS